MSEHVGIDVRLKSCKNVGVLLLGIGSHQGDIEDGRDLSVIGWKTEISKRTILVCYTSETLTEESELYCESYK